MTEARTVRALMTRDPIVVSADAPLQEALRLLDVHRIHGLPVVDGDGALVGVVSQTDMLRARSTQDLWSRWPGLHVRHLMTSPALTIAADADVEDAVRLMEHEHVHRLVVLEPGGCVPLGIISTSDLVHAMLGGPAR
jgi:CBS domain-containing protein